MHSIVLYRTSREKATPMAFLFDIYGDNDIIKIDRAILYDT